MAIHPKDAKRDNPRIQCVVCGQWKRLRSRNPHPPHDCRENFFGGCEYSGGDHLAGKDGDYDVCEECCHIACKALAAAPGKRQVA